VTRFCSHKNLDFTKNYLNICVNNLPARVLAQLPKIHRPKPNRFSVTDLINPPRIRTLQLEKWDQITVDYSDFLNTLIGISVHARQDGLSEAEFSEEKLEETFVVNDQEVTVVGIIDSMDNGIIRDTKTMSPMNMQYYQADKIESITQQLNIYALLARKKGRVVKGLEADIYYVGWKLSEYRRSLPCYAVVQPGRKRALRIFYTEDEAVDYASKDKAYRVEYRPDKGYPSLSFESKKIVLWEEHIQEAFVLARIREHMEKPFLCEDHWKADLRCRDYCVVRSVCPYARKLREDA